MQFELIALGWLEAKAFSVSSLFAMASQRLDKSQF